MLSLHPTLDLCSHICLFPGRCVSSQLLETFCVTVRLIAPFPSQTEHTQAAQPEESRLEGKVGFKAYKNYFSAGASWFFVIFLILLNLAAQVQDDVCAPSVIFAHVHLRVVEALCRSLRIYAVVCCLAGAARVMLTGVENCTEEEKWGYLVRCELGQLVWDVGPGTHLSPLGLSRFLEAPAVFYA